MKCAGCGEEMVFLGHLQTEGSGQGAGGNPASGVELRFDECEEHGIVAARFSKPRAYGSPHDEVPDDP